MYSKAGRHTHISLGEGKNRVGKAFGRIENVWVIVREDPSARLMLRRYINSSAHRLVGCVL